MGIFEPVNDPIWGDNLSGSPDLVRPADAYIKAGWPIDGFGPPRGYMNWFLNEVSNGLLYFMNRGLPLWNSGRTYVAGSVVRGANNGLYVAISNPTVGHDPEAYGSGGEWMPINPGALLGDGSTGDTTFGGGGVSTVATDQAYANLRVNSSSTLVARNSIIRVRGACSIEAGSFIATDNPATIAGANGVAALIGSGGVGNNGISTGTIGGGGMGGDGNGGTGNGQVGGPVLYSLGGAGGVGGTATGTGGAGGTRAVYDPTVQTSLLQILMNGGVGHERDVLAGVLSVVRFLIQGGSGGGGGGYGGSSGGGAGGGAGGGVGILLCSHLNVGADGAFRSPGGHGGNGGAGGGGGGGGGGGAWLIGRRTRTGPALTAAACCPGGAAGTTGAPGAGSVGQVFEFQI